MLSLNSTVVSLVFPAAKLLITTGVGGKEVVTVHGRETRRRRTESAAVLIFRSITITTNRLPGR